MTECVVQLGPLCWTVEWKFYVWLAVMVLVVAPLCLYSLWRLGNGK